MTDRADEGARLRALNRYHILDTASEGAFDDLARLAAHVCGTPIALVSFVDADRLWFKSNIGLDVLELPREATFCSRAILQTDLFVVPDARGDIRFVAHPMVAADPLVRFYAGAPLLTPDGFALGTLCVIDREPRALGPDQAHALRALGRQVVSQLELRRNLAELRRVVTDAGRIEAALRVSETEARKLALVASRTDNAVIITDARGRIEWVNDGFTRITEYQLDEVAGRSPGAFLQGAETDPATADRMRAHLGRGEGFQAEIVNYSRSRRKYWLALDVQPIRDDAGALVHFVAIESDITARKEAEAEARRRAEREICSLNGQLATRLERIGALRRIDLAINSSLDLRVTLDTVLDQVTSQLGVHAAAVLRLDPESQALDPVAVRGFFGPGLARMPLRVGEGPAGRAASDRRLIHVPDLHHSGETPARAALLADEGCVASYAMPLLAKGKVKGVLEVFHRAPLETDREWLDFFEALAGQTANAIENSAMFEALQRSNTELTLAYDATIEGWSRALDLRDKETEGHSRRVTEMTLRLARALGIKGAELAHIRRGALLHDIGKMGIPDAILLKPGPLTDDERTIMQRHPVYAHEWLAPIAFLRPAVEIPYCHHERWDGNGYPRGLRCDQIPLSARIFAAVDIWDALRSDRPYRSGWPDERVRAHLRDLAGTHLDPAIVDVFLRFLADDGAIAIDAAATTDPAGSAIERGLPMVEQLGRAAERIHRLQERTLVLEQANARLGALAATDGLTGLGNRRQFAEALDAAFSFATRQEWPLSLLVLDVDHFGRYNDAHGRTAGDDALRTVAGIVRTDLRPHDMVARLGGGRFAILLEATDFEAGTIIAGRLREAIARHAWPMGPLTVSLGLATMPPDLLTAGDLLEQADCALEHSRQPRRDRDAHHRRSTGRAGGTLHPLSSSSTTVAAASGSDLAES